MTQLFVEAFVLCAIAAVVGVTAASFALDYAARLLVAYNVQLPFWWQFRIGPATVVYAAVLALAGAALVGLLPAIKATGPRVQAALTRMASGGTSMGFGGVWSIMIVLQVTFAALCLPIGLFIATSALRPHKSTAPFSTDEYLTFRPELDRDETLATTAELRATALRAHRVNVYEELKRRLETEPAVAAVTFTDGLPGLHHPLRQVEAQRGSAPPFLVDAHVSWDRVWTVSVDIDFFDAFRMPVVAGRAFHNGDVDANSVVVINETLAHSIGRNPLGTRVRFAAGSADQQAGPWYEVVGIVRDSDTDGTGDEEADFIFLPVSAARMSPLFVAIHVQGDAAAFAPRVRALATQIEPGLRVYELLRLDEVVRRRDPIAVPAMLTVGAITLLAMALSAAGLYSLMSVAVTRRTREIGIRLALGANPGAVLGALFARAAMQVGSGIVIGIALGPPLMSALGQHESVSELLPPMLAAATGMFLVGLVACGVPGRRALRIQATEAMRYGG
jgi:hypothetical protein